MTGVRDHNGTPPGFWGLWDSYFSYKILRFTVAAG